MFQPTSRRGDSLQVVTAERTAEIATKTPSEMKSRGRARTTRTGRIDRRISRVSPGIAGRRRPGPGYRRLRRRASPSVIPKPVLLREASCM